MIRIGFLSTAAVCFKSKAELTCLSATSRRMGASVRAATRQLAGAHAVVVCSQLRCEVSRAKAIAAHGGGRIQHELRSLGRGSRKAHSAVRVCDCLAVCADAALALERERLHAQLLRELE
jgi:NADH:ubiquinone oxidoreductase subunit E